MAKYSKTAEKSVENAMHRMKKGKLESGNSGKKVTNPKQAIAIGLSEAREKGAKVPAAKKGAVKKGAAKKSAARKTSPGTTEKKKPVTKRSASTAKAKPGPKPGSKKSGTR